MEPIVRSNHYFRFRSFSFDPETRELFSKGIKQRIHGQPLEVLAMLIVHPGELVTREALQKALWPDGTFVDFENSLNNNIKRLREALGDDPGSPSFIETVPKHGYRFIAPVTTPSIETVSTVGYINPAVESVTRKADGANARLERKRGRRTTIVVSVLVFLMASAGLAWYLLQPVPQLRITKYVQLTNDGRIKFIGGTDGNNLYLSLFQPEANATLPISGGRLTELAVDLSTASESPSSTPFIAGVSPDGSRLLVGGNWDPSSGVNLWVVGTHGSTARYLTSGDGAAWSPDGETLAYTKLNGDLFTIPSEGGESKLLLASTDVSAQTHFGQGLAWSPDGSRIRFTREGRYWEVSADGTNAHELLPDWHRANPRYTMLNGQWTPDGDFFLFAARNNAPSLNGILSQNLGTQIWALNEHRPWLHQHSEPVQLTSGATSWGIDGFVVSKDGAKVYATGTSSRGELVVYDTKSRTMKPFLGGISAEFVDFSRDGKHVVYVTFPDGVMWRANRDGTGLTQLTNPPLYPMNPRWSPDGTQIIFFDASGSEAYSMYAIPSEGGIPKPLLPGDPKVQIDPGWSPDGKKIIFTESKGVDLIGAASRILDLANGTIADMPPGPKSIVSPRWSPDGRFILGMTTVPPALALFDMHTHRWSLIRLGGGVQCNFPSWSHDSRFIYFLNTDWAIFKSSSPGVYRVSITGGKPEKVVDLRGFTPAGFPGLWFGLDPDDNPLMLRDAGTNEVYALTLERK